MGFPAITDSRVEIIDEPPVAEVRHAVLDMDGTVSLLRDGWQDHMIPLMVDVLEACPRHEARDELEGLVIDFVDHLTGKQTIYQMLRLAEEVEKRGGKPLDPLEYKRQYYARLNEALVERLTSLRQGRASADEFLLAGARSFLEELDRRGIRCYLASGTDIAFVREEAELLDVARYFKGGILGALPNYKAFSKEIVIRKIIADFHLTGPELLIVGDGYVEIQNAREVGAVAYGIHSRENNRYHMNANKRNRLLRAGAHLLAPDLEDGRKVLDYLAR